MRLEWAGARRSRGSHTGRVGERDPEFQVQGSLGAKRKHLDQGYFSYGHRRPLDSKRQTHESKIS